MAATYHDQALSVALAVDLCSLWQHETGKSAISVDDLKQVKEWVCAVGNNILKYPTMMPLAARGLDDLIAGSRRDGCASLFGI